MKSVMIWGYTNFKWLWVPLAKELKRTHGAQIHFVCTDHQSVEYWKRQDSDGVIDSFTTTNHFFNDYDTVEAPPEMVYSRAQQYEDEYKILVVDILQTDRHLGRGFFAGGIGHPKSQLSEKANYLKSVNFCNNAFAFWERFIKEKKPDLILGLASSVLGKTCTVVARSNGIPVRDLFRANYGAYYAWAFDEYYSVTGLRSEIQRLSDVQWQSTTEDEELSALRRLPFTDEYYRNFRHSLSWPSIATKILQQCEWSVYQWIKGRRTVGNYKFSEKIHSLVQMRTDFNTLMRYRFVSQEELKNNTFFLLALHVEPESSVGMQSPEMNEQLAAIEFVAKNLPAGTYLAVKEHLAAVGRRPRDFYATIAAIPNVLLVSPYAYALDVARLARGVVVITSTLGMEAAMLGIPVISFGLHNNYNILQHVHTVESWTQLRPLLLQLLSKDAEEARKTRQEDGRKYLAALKNVCTDLSWMDRASKHREKANAQEVEIIHASLRKSLSI